MKSFQLLILFGLVLVLTTFHPRAFAQPPQKNLSSSVADTYGLQKFKHIESITYTFHVQKGSKKVQRSWRWEPQNGRVSFRQNSKQKWITYTRKSSTAGESKQTRKIDRWFINDQYWLLFPFHLKWDKSATVKSKVMTKALKWGKYTLHPKHELSIQYPKQGGYTPGDLYKLYISDQKRVVAWSFHKGGQVKPSRRTTWENTKQFGPIQLSLTRNGIKPTFRIWFTDVAVKTKK